MNLLSGCAQSYIWLFAVAFLGGLVGCWKRLDGEPVSIRGYFKHIVAAIFVAYVSYEMMDGIVEKQNIRIAIAGLAAFLEHDALEILKKYIMRKIDKYGS
jgi:hypothetical protein